MVEGRDGRTKEGRGGRAARTDREQTAPAGHFEAFAKNASYMGGGFVKDRLVSHRLASAAFHLDHTAAVPPPTSSWALTMGNNVAEVRDRLLAAWVVWGARLRRGPGAPLTRRGVSPTLTKRGEARTAARFINSTHLLVPSPVQRRSGRLPPRPPGPLRVLELCLSTASAMAAPLWGVA